ncbi:MAG: [FeFe] hydrogenase H-cluster maturation GTPase HydF, partial [Clostridia bacterium]|nr:[FeFe] hydrogenase H-cluster maturation GTPase HydF [Clostridia bacterium]
GALGEKRVEKTAEVLGRTDLAVLVIDSQKGVTEHDRELKRIIAFRGIRLIEAWNKADLKKPAGLPENAVAVSAKTGEGVTELKERIAALGKKEERVIVADLLPKNACAVLVMPIDESAPKGRLILPQQLVLRELLDHNMTALCCQPAQLNALLSRLTEPPAMVITDSQAFGPVSKSVPESVPLTSFSILMARFRGELFSQLNGVNVLRNLKDGDLVQISEGCTHHRQCRDIGTVKLPGWIEAYSGAKPEYRFTSGGGFPKDLSGVKLIVHCGGCMLPQAEMHTRAEAAAEAGVSMVNYGVAIAAMHGILARSIAPIPGAAAALSGS